MVATVHTLVVGVGDAVSPGDILVLLESMKMEIPVLAELSGRLAEMAVAPGDVIHEGDLIAVIDVTA